MFRFGGSSDERYVGVDIGTNAIKLMELDITGSQPKLVSAAIAPAPAGAVKNNTVLRPDDVAAVIRSTLEAHGIHATKAVTPLPGPSVFTKKIQLPATDLKELRSTIQFEASNYIPHNIGDVRLDFQVLQMLGNRTLEVLLVAVKNEIIDSYLDTLEQTGLEPAIADVDYFALENMFELSYPEEKEKTVALVNIGARYTSINILQNGESLFTGDVSIGGRLYTDALCETMELKPADAEQAKMGTIPEGLDPNLVSEALDRTTDHIASELQRQLGFFWNAAATDRQIETIYLCGGGGQVSGLLEELGVKTGIPCQWLDPFRNIDCSAGFDSDYLQEIAPSMGISVGLSLRRDGDKQHAIE